MTRKWLSVVGIGEDGLAGLSPIARTLIDHADVLVGGDRHLAMLPNDDRERLVWTSPLRESIDEILRRRRQAICVLASGDPMWYGIGVTLLRRIPLEEMTILPAPSTFSLACARLGWSLTEVETVSLCNRPPELLHTYLYPGAKLLILSEGKQTPAIVADRLTRRGFGNSSMIVLERLGGVHERHIEGIASNWRETDLADLSAIAVECIADPGTTTLPRTPGLPDDAYHHDGQLTKREVRALTLSALAPIPGELLWDVGAGCGSIAIEWMRSHPRCRAIAIEKARTQYIADNAAALGTPGLHIIDGKAPATLKDLPQPNAIFIGGGVTADGMLETCWAALPPGGRLVANVVTIEGERRLFQWQEKVGGTFTRITVQRAEPIGRFLGWRSLAPITQWAVVKSA
ncbi:precorrin-6y C5,15-methyltransferase (decarboxylating) subunit CbiE [Stenomitos frigidus]|uniref:Cobalamin biosynthesis bifunctional protein CbiET n=1 Tax=Stenomitos frigidus ULC18 TaxID=2107698 RepID=A0A2T1DSL0_9CYAN|nr:precorrin-6y C5,15-methyltransferase (decarboxylating) subunit CbiE [Stenomitos frigidus]PSB23455.1 cobalamin biosynthesis bifunctional protein CbiET [Stenomitos frigidus ULC18]